MGPVGIVRVFNVSDSARSLYDGLHLHHLVMTVVAMIVVLHAIHFIAYHYRRPLQS